METTKWLSYFETNRSNLLNIPEEVYRLTNTERIRIAKSVQTFQLGESSEGQVLRRQAKAQSQKMNRPEYLKAIEHLIREENRHSAYLGKFMQMHDIPKAKKTWNDFFFRFLRHLAGAELSTRVLVAAEVIALTFYDCLGDATGSTALKSICQRMCEEETKHIEFQMHHIHEFNFRKYTLMAACSNILHFLLCYAVLLPVWIENKSVLKTKYTFLPFCKKVCSDFKKYTMDGQSSAALSLVESGFLSREALCF